MSYFLSSGQAAVIVLANALVSKMYMTVAFRFKIAAAKKAGRKDIIDGADYKTASSAQLNDAEYSPIFLATLLYLHSQNNAAPVASTLAAFGCVAYVWAKIYLPFPSQSIGACARYVSMGMICMELYKMTFP
jgi:uncharacterized MAPEG superfamily protein